MRFGLLMSVQMSPDERDVAAGGYARPRHILDTPLATRLLPARYALRMLLSARRAIDAKVDAEPGRGLPAILVNSIPKSGTHLAIQLLRATPGARYYGSFIAWGSARTLSAKSDQRIVDEIKRILPGEVVGGHLHYSATVDDLLSRRSIVHFLCIRDPVGIVTSEAYYLLYMNSWHRMSPILRKASCTTKALDTVIDGYDELYPSIGARVQSYVEWLCRSHVLPIYYENLIDDQCRSAARDLAMGIIRSGWPVSYSVEHLSDLYASARSPSYSHTFARNQKFPRPVLSSEQAMRIRHLCGEYYAILAARGRAEAPAG